MSKMTGGFISGSAPLLRIKVSHLGTFVKDFEYSSVFLCELLWLQFVPCFCLQVVPTLVMKETLTWRLQSYGSTSSTVLKRKMSKYTDAYMIIGMETG